MLETFFSNGINVKIYLSNVIKSKQDNVIMWCV